MAYVGSVPLARSAIVSSEVVVVLPWVPATATTRRPDITDFRPADRGGDPKTAGLCLEHLGVVVTGGGGDHDGATGERPTALQIDDLIAEGRENVPKRELTEKHQLRMKRDRVFANRYRRKKREREQIAWRRREVFVQEIGPICPQDKLPFIIDFLEHADIEDVRSVGGRLRNYLRRKGYIGPMKDYRP